MNCKNKKIHGAGGTIVLMIGLYLIILAFFILLNAISESSDSKAKQASNSLKEAFGFVSGEVVEDKQDTNISVQDFYKGIAEKIKGVVSSYFESDKISFNIKQDTIVLSIEADQFFQNSTTTVNPFIYPFIYDTILVINKISAGVDIHLELNLEVRKTSETAAAGFGDSPMAIAALRISDISKIIENEKVDIDKFKASVSLGSENRVNMFIKIIVNDYQKALLNYDQYIQY